MSLTSERIQEILDTSPELGKDPQVELAKLSGASKSTVNQWLSGNIKTVRLEYALAIEKALGWNHVWIVLGTGEKKVGAAPAKEAAELSPLQSAAVRTLEYVDDHELALLTNYRAATPTGRAMIEEAARVVPKLAEIETLKPTKTNAK
jgi:transcriptional regulator with XRE-family HTH domain